MTKKFLPQIILLARMFADLQHGAKPKGTQSYNHTHKSCDAVNACIIQTPAKHIRLGPFYNHDNNRVGEHSNAF